METRIVDASQPRMRIELPVLAMILAGIVAAGSAEPPARAGEVRPPSAAASVARWVPEQHNQVLL